MNPDGTGNDRERTPEVVLVTGASAGLGLAIARLLLATNLRLILTARSESMGRFSSEGIAESERVWLRPLNVTHEADLQTDKDKLSCLSQSQKPRQLAFAAELGC
jgi:NADP-dependent 3-hydroxy acid dehydrogenase YdfG